MCIGSALKSASSTKFNGSNRLLARDTNIHCIFILDLDRNADLVSNHAAGQTNRQAERQHDKKHSLLAEVKISATHNIINLL